MPRHAKNITFAVVVALVFAAAQVGHTAPRKGPPVAAEVSTLKELHEALAKATPGSVIRLAAGIYQIYADDPYFLVKDVQGLPDQPIVIQGAASNEEGRRPTIIDGGRSLSPMLEVEEHYGKAGSRPVELHDLLIEKQFRTERAINCFVFENVAYLIIENLTVRNCLPAAFVIYGNSRYVAVRASALVGGMMPVFAGRYSDHLLVEDNVWTQDPSGYTEDQSGYSGRVDLAPRSGRMWDTIPWGVVHHGSPDNATVSIRYISSDYAGHRLSVVQFAQAPYFNHLDAVYARFRHGTPFHCDRGWCLPLVAEDCALPKQRSH